VVDTHAHLGMCEPGGGELVAAAREAGVRRILTVGIDESSNRDAIAAAEGHEEVFACVGRHPNSADGFDDAAADVLEELAAHERVRAIGETGLDYYREGAPRVAQRAAFEAQIEVAGRVEMPLVIHMRDSLDDTFEVLASEADGVTVILHCFSAPPERVADAVGNGWHCSFAGNLTYPRSEQLREAARLVPDELLLVETDSPFLAPQSVRGKPNQPANVAETARRLAEIRDVSYQRLEETVEANAARLFGW
jgi:TatD DNase family protein